MDQQTHYLAVFAVMIKKDKHHERGQQNLLEELVMTLLSMSPISKRDKDSEVISSHSIHLDTETHVRQLESVLYCYHVDVH